jgi:hypothetical protein
MGERPQAEAEQRSGLSRREMLRRAGIVGGTLLWAVPAVQSLTPPAYAHVSPGGFYCCQCRHDQNRGACQSGFDPSFTIDDCTEFCNGQTDPQGGWQVEGFHRDNTEFMCSGPTENPFCTHPAHDVTQ